MGAPKRISNWVLILSPVNGNGLRSAVTSGQQACREAHLRGMTPIFPLFQSMGFLTEEELQKDLGRITRSWSRRVSRLWLCLSPDQTGVDPVTHDVLLDNEGHMAAKIKHYRAPSRLPVYRFWVDDRGKSFLDNMERVEVNELLRCNILDGLFRGSSMTC